jgi:hypothetical protein
MSPIPFPHAVLPSGAHRLRRLLLLPIAALVLATGARAQVASTYELGLRYEFGVPLGINRSPEPVDTCNCNGDGASYNQTAGVVARVSLPHLLGDAVGLRAEAGVAASVGRFTSDRYYDISQDLDGTLGAVDSALYDFTVTSNYLLLHLGLRADFALSDAFTLSAGLWGGMRAGGTFEKRLRLQDSLGLKFADGSRERVVATNGNLSAGTLTGGVLLGAGALIPIDRGLALVPELYTGIDPLAVPQLGVRALSAGLSVAVRLGGAAEAPAVEPPPTAPPKPAPALAPPVASVDLFSLDEQGNHRSAIDLEPRRVAHSRIVQLLPFVFFPAGSDAVPALYGLEQESAAPLPDSLPDPLLISVRSLETLGRRLGALPSAAITLVGVVADGETASLGGRRAVRLRALLAERFGVDSTRVRIGSETQGSQGGVLLLVPPALLAPVERRWFVDDFRSPPIGLRPHIEAAAGVRAWTIELRHDGRLVGRYTSDRSGEIEPEFSVALDSVVADTMLAPLVGTLTVEDSAGRRSTATAELPVRALHGGAGAVTASHMTAWLPDLSWLPQSVLPARDSAVARIASGLDAEAQITACSLVYGQAPDGEVGLPGSAQALLYALDAVRSRPAGATRGEVRPLRREPSRLDALLRGPLEVVDIEAERAK